LYRFFTLTRCRKSSTLKLMKKIRTFTGIAFPEDLRKDLADMGNTVFAGARGIRWVKENAIHLTLKFLGDVPIDDTAEITDAFTGAAGGIEPFEIKIGGSGTFPPKGRPRIIWAGISEPTGRVQDLFEAIDKAAEPFGIARETKRYHAHVTIGRVKGRIGYEDIAPGLEEMNGIDFGTLEVKEVTFFMSELTGTGPIYTVLATIPLGKNVGAGLRPAQS